MAVVEPSAELLLVYADPRVAERVRRRLGAPGPRGSRDGDAAGAASANAVSANAAAAGVTSVRAASAAEPAVPEHAPADAASALAFAPPPGQSEYPVESLEFALRRGLVTPRDVAFRGAPGWAAIRALERFALSADGTLLAPVDRVLAEAAELLPGPDAMAWRWLITRAPDYPGTFPQLCAEAAEAADAARTADAAKSAGADAGGRSGPGMPGGGPWTGTILLGRYARSASSGLPCIGLAREARAAVGLPSMTAWHVHSPGGMLGRVDADVLARVMPMLPMEALHGMLHGAALPLPLVLAVIRHEPKLAAVFASRVRRSAEAVRELSDLAEPMVNYGLLEHDPDPADSHLVHMATRNNAPRRVRLSPWIRDRLRESGSPVRGQLVHAVVGHHPDLLRAALREAPEQLGTAGVLRALLSLWECVGRAALLDPRVSSVLAPEAAAVARRAVRALDGRRVLRGEVAYHEHPLRRVAAIRANPELARRHVPAAFWPHVAAEHARDPLPREAVRTLARHRACPDAFGVDAARADEEAAAGLARRSRAHALAALRYPLHEPAWFVPADRVRPQAPWYVGALSDGLITAAEFVELTRPAERTLKAIRAFGVYFPEARAVAHEAVAAHAAKTIGDNPDAWTVAIRLAPDFSGTVPELLDTAAAVFA
ncbi:hypothetical protein [Yinghuangia sp. YIM S09857]|uniref:hypothetical protein n=1 Tax=Yinghuangia sp. YIM S09857 TaxID=3436929 RepID=UPI003F5299AD